MMDYLVGFDPKDKATWEELINIQKVTHLIFKKDSLDGARIGFVPQLLGDGSHPDHPIVTKVTMKAIEDMKSAGAIVFPVSIPLLDDIAAGSFVLSVSGFESMWTMDEYFTSLGPDSKFKNLKEFVAAGLTYKPILDRLKEDTKIGKRIGQP